ncbi:hypothetical protein ACSQ67_004142 [Phaseolus vulgaris]
MHTFGRKGCCVKFLYYPRVSVLSGPKKGWFRLFISTVGLVFCLGLVEAEAVVARSCLPKSNKFWRNNPLRSRGFCTLSVTVDASEVKTSQHLKKDQRFWCVAEARLGLDMRGRSHNSSFSLSS